MSERVCGTCKADETWCWIFTTNKGECPCAHCDKNKDCDIVFADDDNGGQECEKFHLQ
jgi:hypothetical protein